MGRGQAVRAISFPRGKARAVLKSAQRGGGVQRRRVFGAGLGRREAQPPGEGGRGCSHRQAGEGCRATDWRPDDCRLRERVKRGTGVIGGRGGEGGFGGRRWRDQAGAAVQGGEGGAQPVGGRELCPFRAWCGWRGRCSRGVAPGCRRAPRWGARGRAAHPFRLVAFGCMPPHWWCIMIVRITLAPTGRPVIARGNAPGKSPATSPSPERA